MKFWTASRGAKPFLFVSLVVALVSLTAAGIDRSDSKTPLVAYTGIWNGSHTDLNIAECSNLDRRPGTYDLVVFNSNGHRLGSQQFTLAPLGTTHLNLRDVIKRNLNGSFGTYRIESTTGSDPAALTCLTSVYRKAGKRAKTSIEFGYIIPSPLSVSGPSGGILQNDLSQELLIYNSGDSDFSANVEIAGLDADSRERSNLALTSLAPGQIRRFKFRSAAASAESAKTRNGRGRAALYRILPANSESEYGAVLVTYSKRRAGAYNFALSKLASEGTCSGGPIFISTRDNSQPVAQLANLDDSEHTVEIEIRDATGSLVNTAHEKLSPHSGSILELAQLLGTNAIGSFQARCDSDSRLLSEIVHYGLDKKQRIQWAYATQARGNLGSSQIAIASSLKTSAQRHAGADTPQPDNRSLIVNAGSAPLAVKLTIFEGNGSPVGAIRADLTANGADVTELYKEIGPDFKGLGVSIASIDGAQFSSELLRVFPRKGGGIGSIVSVPSAGSGTTQLAALVRGEASGVGTEGADSPQVAALGAPVLECSTTATGPWNSSYCIFTYGQKIYQRITNYQPNTDIEFKWTNGGTTTWSGPLPNPATPGQNYRSNSSGTVIAGPLPSASGIPSDWPARPGYRNWVCYAGTCSNEVDFTVATSNPPTPILEIGKSASGPWYLSGLTFYYGEKVYLRVRGATASTAINYEWTNGSTSVFGGPGSPMPNPVGGTYSTNLIGEVIAGPFPSASGIPSDGSWPIRSGYRNTVFVSGKRSNDAILAVAGAPISNYLLLQGIVFDGATGAQWTGSSISLDPYGGSLSRCGPNPGIEANTTTTCLVPYSPPYSPGAYYAKNYVYSTNYTRIKAGIPAGRKALISLAPFGCTTDCHPYSSYCVAKVASGKADVKVGNIPNPRPPIVDLWWAYVPSPDPSGAVYRDCDANTGLPIAPAAGFNYNLTNRGNVTLLPGGSGVATIDATLTGGVATPVAFDTSGLPQGVTASFSRVSCNPTCSATLTLSAALSTMPATYPITIKGSPLNKTTTFNLIVNNPAISEKILVQGYAYDGTTGAPWSGAPVTIDPDGTDGVASTCGTSPTTQGGPSCTIPSTNPYYAQTEILAGNRAHITSTLPTNSKALVSLCYNSGAYGPCPGNLHPFSTYCVAPIVNGKADVTFNNIPTPRPAVIDLWWAYIPASSTQYPVCDVNTATPAAPASGFNYSLVVQSGQSSTISLIAGQSAQRTIELWNTSSPFSTHPVGLDLIGVPTGLTAYLSSVACSPNCSATLTVNASNYASSGTFTIKGTPLDKTLPITVNVTPATTGSVEGWTFEQNTANGVATSVTSPGLPTQSTNSSNGYRYTFLNFPAAVRTFSITLPSGFLSAQSCNAQLVSDSAYSATCSTGWVNGTSRSITVYPGEQMRLRWRLSRSAGPAVTTTTPTGNNSACGSIIAPASVPAGGEFSASVTLYNTGTKSWTNNVNESNHHRLGSQSPADNTRWGFMRAELPAPVNPGSAVTFELNARAPASVGTHSFDWQMREEGIEWFGELCRTTITVTSPLPPLANKDRLFNFELPMAQDPALVASATNATGSVFRDSYYSRSGSWSAFVSGTDASIANNSSIYFTLYDLTSAPIPIYPNTWFEYYIKPVAGNAKNVGVDLLLDNNTYLRNATVIDIDNLPMHPAAAGNRRGLTTGKYRLVRGHIGAKLAGRSIKAVLAGYDQLPNGTPGNSGFTASIDDIRIYNEGFVSGDRVIGAHYELNKVPIRGSASPFASTIGEQTSLATGLVVGSSSAGFTNVNFDSGVDGWVDTRQLVSQAEIDATLTTQSRPSATGDVDGNGAFGVTDGVMALRCAADLPPCLPGAIDANMFRAADCNVNNAVSVSDGVQVLRAAAGLSSECTTNITFEKIEGTDVYTPAGSPAGNPKCRARSIPANQFCMDVYGQPTTVSSAQFGTITSYTFYGSQLQPVLGYPNQLSYIWDATAGPPLAPPGVTDNFLLNFSGDFDFSAGAFGRAGVHVFKVNVDDGVKLIVDDTDVLIDKWQLQDATHYNSRLLKDRHKVRVVYFDGGGVGKLLVDWYSRATNLGLPPLHPRFKHDDLNGECKEKSAYEPHDANLFQRMGENDWVGRLGDLKTEHGLITDKPGAALSFSWAGTNLYGIFRSGSNSRGIVGVTEDNIGYSGLIPDDGNDFVTIQLAVQPEGLHHYTIAASDEIRGSGAPLLIRGFKVYNSNHPCIDECGAFLQPKCDDNGGGPVDSGRGIKGTGYGSTYRPNKVQVSLIAPTKLNGACITLNLWQCLPAVGGGNGCSQYPQSVCNASNTQVAWNNISGNAELWLEVLSAQGALPTSADVMMHKCRNCVSHSVKNFSRNPQEDENFVITNPNIYLGSGLVNFVDAEVFVVPAGSSVYGEEFALTAEGTASELKSLRSAESQTAATVGLVPARWDDCVPRTMFLHPSVTLPGILEFGGPAMTSQAFAVRNAWRSVAPYLNIQDFSSTGDDVPPGYVDSFSMLAVVPSSYQWEHPFTGAITSFDQKAPQANELTIFGYLLEKGFTYSSGRFSLAKHLIINERFVTGDIAQVRNLGVLDRKEWFQNVVLHEYGHYLGLPDDDDPSLLMGRALNLPFSTTTPWTIPNGDIQNLQNAYRGSRCLP